MKPKIQKKINLIIEKYNCSQKSHEKLKKFLLKIKNKYIEKGIKNEDIKILLEQIKKYYDLECASHSKKVITNTKINNKCTQCGH